MSVTFMEYQVLPEHRPAYSNWMEQVRALYPELEVYEGTDQPGLFVELWSGQSHDEYEQLKKARLQPDSKLVLEQAQSGIFDKFDWNPLHQWVRGGADKIHIWHFEKVR